jgi:hypothetical protein
VVGHEAGVRGGALKTWAWEVGRAGQMQDAGRGAHGAREVGWLARWTGSLVGWLDLWVQVMN